MRGARTIDLPCGVLASLESCRVRIRTRRTVRLSSRPRSPAPVTGERARLAVRSEHRARSIVNADLLGRASNGNRLGQSGCRSSA